MNILKYLHFEGTAELDMDRNVCRGKILFIDDLVTYEADSPAGLKKEFEAAVDDYLQTCKELDRTPKRPLKGLFNVRMSPALHKDMVLRALQDHCSLNEAVAQACSMYIRTKPTINNVQLTVNIPAQLHKAVMFDNKQPATWERFNVH